MIGADSVMVDTVLKDTFITDTMLRDTTEAVRTVGLSPILWVAILAVIIVAVVILVVVFLRPGRGRGKSSKEAYLDGLRALLDGDPVTAAREFRDAVMEDTENIDAYIRLGRLMREKGDAEKASQIHQSLTARPSLSLTEEIRIYEELLADYLALGRTEKSIALLKEIVGIARDKLGYLRRLLSILVSNSRAIEALEILRQYRKVFSGRDEAAIWYAEVARILYTTDEVQADEVLKQAQKLSKNHPYILVVQAESFVNRGQWGKARNMLDKFIKQCPENAEKVLDLVEKTYFEEGTYEKLKPLYENLLERFPDKDQIRLRLIKLYGKEGKSKHALELINNRLLENPSDAVLLVELVKLKLAANDLKAAGQAFERLEEMLFLMPDLCPECGSELEPSAWMCTSCGNVICS
ncbi:hypothetical protein JXM67_09980 [candidate division WOR-3 bacterium]|nr:hypothetical protein [candidate division WOR-3 bacterium]